MNIRQFIMSKRLTVAKYCQRSHFIPVYLLGTVSVANSTDSHNAPSNFSKNCHVWCIFFSVLIQLKVLRWSNECRSIHWQNSWLDKQKMIVNKPLFCDCQRFINPIICHVVANWIHWLKICFLLNWIYCEKKIWTFMLLINNIVG